MLFLLPILVQNRINSFFFSPPLPPKPVDDLNKRGRDESGIFLIDISISPERAIDFEKDGEAKPDKNTIKKNPVKKLTKKKQNKRQKKNKRKKTAADPTEVDLKKKVDDEMKQNLLTKCDCRKFPLKSNTN